MEQWHHESSELNRKAKDAAALQREEAYVLAVIFMSAQLLILSLSSIVTKLLELGYTRRDFPERNDEFNKMLKQPRPLSARSLFNRSIPRHMSTLLTYVSVWNNIRPQIGRATRLNSSHSGESRMPSSA